jgi:hypothetical protein
MSAQPGHPVGRQVVHPLNDGAESGPATDEEIAAMEREQVSPDLIKLARRQAERRAWSWRFFWRPSSRNP